MIIFNGVDLSSYVRVVSISGRGVVSTEIEMDSVPGGDGAYQRSKRIPERILTCQFRMYSKTLEELRKKTEELNGVLKTDNVVPIVFNDEKDRTYYGISGGVEENADRENVGVYDFEIEIVCFDPYKYGDEHTETTIRRLFWEDYASKTWEELADGDINT